MGPETMDNCADEAQNQFSSKLHEASAGARLYLAESALQEEKS
jgi:hypothetical protein